MPTVRQIPFRMFEHVFYEYAGSPVYGSGSGKRFTNDFSHLGQVTYGDNYPNWKQRIKLRQSATTSLTGYGYKSKGSTSTVFATNAFVWPPDTVNWNLTQKHRGCLLGLVGNPGLGSPSSGAADQAVNLAKTKVLKKAIAAQRAFQSGVFLGELRETISFIRKPAATLRNITGEWINDWGKRARKIRRSKKFINRPLNDASVVKALRHAASDSWLELAFAANPLVSDVKSAVEAAIRLKEVHQPSKIVRGKAVVPISVVTNDQIQDVDGFQYAYTIKRTEACQARMTACISTTAHGDSGSYNLGQLGANWQQVLPTVWELIPYSFLVDYFTNIGDIIEGLAFCSASVRWAELGTLYSKRNALTKCEMRPGMIPSWAVSTFFSKSLNLHDQDTWVEYREFSRSAYNGSLTPSLSFEIPGFKSRKWLNIAALANNWSHVPGYVRR